MFIESEMISIFNTVFKLYRKCKKYIYTNLNPYTTAIIPACCRVHIQTLH